ncbi:hypothetical protein ACWEOS_18580 [Micromonospora taraxaci]
MTDTSSDEPTPTGPADPPPPPPAAVAEVNPVRLPEWMHSAQTEHQPTGWDRVRFFSARHNGALLVGLGLVLALLMVVGGGVLVTHVAGGTTAAPSGDPGEPRDLFADTPAASFAPAEEAVVLPTANPTGPFSAAEVRAALESVREALIKGRVDSSMLLGNRVPFLALFGPDAAKQVGPYFRDGGFLSFATRISTPERWDDTRANGRISYRATEEDDIRLLEVTTEFVWAYSFTVDVRAPAGAGVVVIRDKVIWQVPHTGDVQAVSQGLWLASADAVSWNVRCDGLRDGWVQEQTWSADRHLDQLPAGDPGTIFDLDAPPPTTTRC